jgi:uncharacterized protein
MLIEIRELEAHPIDFDEELSPEAIDLSPDWRQTGPIKSTGRAQLVEEHHGKHRLIKDIRVAGNLKARIETGCARCLEPVQCDISRDFDLLYRPQGADAGLQETPVTTAEAEVSYYQGEGLLLEDVIREQALLGAPLRAICREDCKGLCPSCGKNLNVEACGCAQSLEDDRWSALKDIRSKFNN